MMKGEDEEDDLRDATTTTTNCDSWSHAATWDSYRDTLRRHKIYATMSAVGVVLLVVFVAMTTTRNGRYDSLIDDIPTYATVAEEQKELYALLEHTMTDLDLPTVDDLLLRNSYQYKAFDWLANDNSDIEMYDDNRKLQRFALACFYHATNNYQVAGTEQHTTPNNGMILPVQQQQPWTYDEYWLTDKHECDWMGVHCTASKRIHSISLERNNLSGKLPLELALLHDTLKGLDLSTNAIMLKDDDYKLFEYLPRLEKLLLDDNYLVTTNGLPSSLKTCTDLRKLRLSYNLLDGPLNNGVLNNLKKLTHLEVESNYLTGALPFLADMAELRQIYLRQNNLRGHLNFIKSVNSRNIQHLWLDGNTISQSIPTQIGKLTQLESISIADAKLTGTLPTEMGRLSTLKRIWLSNNQLTGPIPTELKKLSQLELFKVQKNGLNGRIPNTLCQTVNASTYEYKTIMVDCDVVECSCC